MPVATAPAILHLPLHRKQNLGELVAEALRQAVIGGQLLPGGSIPEEKIAAQLRVSRASVREAIMLLEQERLVTRTPSRRVRVAFLSHQDAEEIFSLRGALERLAVERVLRRGVGADLLDQLEATNRKLNEKPTPNERASIDLEFHETLMRAARHDRLLESWLRLRSQLRLVMMHRSIIDASSARSTIRAHQRLIKALRVGNEALAVKLVRDQSAAQVAWFRNAFTAASDEASPGLSSRRSANA